MTVSRVRLLQALVVLAASALLGGCRLQADVAVHLDRDGGGLVGVVASVDEELARRLADVGADPLGDVASAAAEEPGWQVEREPRRLELIRRADSPEELEAAVADLARGLDAAEVSPLRPLRVTVDEQTLQVAWGGGLQVTDAVTELGVDPDAAAEALQEAVDYTLQVVLPGEVLETTGRIVEEPAPGGEETVPGGDGGTVIAWPVAVGEQVDVRAVGERPRGSTWPVLIGAGVAVVAAAGVVAAVVSRRRRRP